MKKVMLYLGIIIIGVSMLISTQKSKADSGSGSTYNCPDAHAAKCISDPDVPEASGTGNRQKGGDCYQMPDVDGMVSCNGTADLRAGAEKSAE